MKTKKSKNNFNNIHFKMIKLNKLKLNMIKLNKLNLEMIKLDRLNFDTIDFKKFKENFKKMIHPSRGFKHWFSAPFIWAVLIPLMITDLFMEFYHRICFPLYGIKYVKRSEYVRIDRHRLKYLNIIQKFACAYCGYANGLLAYGVKIAGETEKYWCAIKHQENKNFKPPMHHKDFLAYNDADSFRKKYN